MAGRIDAWLGLEHGGRAELWLGMQVDYDYDLWQASRKPAPKVEPAPGSWCLVLNYQ